MELDRPGFAGPLYRRDVGVSWETLRYVLFISFLVLIWLAPNPNAVSFREDPGAGREGNFLQQALWFSMLFAGLLFCQNRWGHVRQQFDVTLILMLAWCLFTVPFAIVPDVSMRRLMFTTIAMFVIIFMAGGLERPQSILWLLLTALVVETLTKYLFVFGIPTLGRHGFDSLEPHLMGMWRGQYAHKNVAGAICAIELFILFAARRQIPAAYLMMLGALQVIFLVMSGSKTPIAIVFFVMILARLILRMRHLVSMLALATATVIIINAITVLTVISDTMRQYVSWVIGDANFTGRADIWGILLSYAADHIVMGAGFLSFWQIGFLSPAMQDARSWASSAIYGHQGYLDLAVTIGIPGLLLTLLFLLVRPCVDLAGIRQRNNPILEMYVSFWLFGILHNGTETNILGRADSVWLFIVMGIVGIRRTRIDDAEAQRSQPLHQNSGKER